MKANAYRANRMDLSECSFGITKATSSKVEEIVTLVSKPCEVPALVATFVWGVNSKGFVLF